MSEDKEKVSGFPVTSGQDWNFDMIEEVYDRIKKIADEKYGLDYYPNQLEVISSEQMLDAYASVGLPVYYSHWSFGESFIKQMEAYKRGHMGLAYEIVINSKPCIAYLMEENTMLMQTLVIAHASFGHNHFFKNNYLFKQWTDAEGIIDYLVFAKKFIRECEERYGVDEVEATLDAAHSLQSYGVNKYKRPPKLSAAQEAALREEREKWYQSQINVIWNTIPHTKDEEKNEEDDYRFLKESEENILYFIEKNAPRMPSWKREILRIVRRISQYFYPQSQTKVMNEGCATYFHYKIMHDLHEEGTVDDGAMLEFYHSHTGVVYQPDFDSKWFSGINPYALGFAMMMDIERIAMDPTEEDREWFRGQEWVGSGDYISAIKYAIENFKDESFIHQYLSPKVIRDLKMFAIHDDDVDPQLEVSGIHNHRGYKTVRDALSRQYAIANYLPDIQVWDIDKWGDRTLTLRHTMHNRRPLNADETLETLKHVAFLWEYNVVLESIDDEDDVKAIFEIADGESMVDIFTDEE